MYVLKYEVPTGGSAISGLVSAGTTAFLPAERCVYVTEYSTSLDAYIVSGSHNLRFINGAGTNITTNLDESGNIVTLGYIGKSGRFVGITAPNTLA